MTAVTANHGFHNVSKVEICEIREQRAGLQTCTIRIYDENDESFDIDIFCNSDRQNLEVSLKIKGVRISAEVEED